MLKNKTKTLLTSSTALLVAITINITLPTTTFADTVVPESPEVKHLADFSGAIRCMDSLLDAYGIRDLTVMTEYLHGSNFPAMSKAILEETLSDMSRRSHAFRVISYGTNRSDLIGFLTAAQIGPNGTGSESDSNTTSMEDSQQKEGAVATQTGSAPPTNTSIKQQSTATTGQPSADNSASEDDNDDQGTDQASSSDVHAYGVIPQYDISGAIAYELQAQPKASNEAALAPTDSSIAVEAVVSMNLSAVDGLNFSLSPGNVVANTAWINSIDHAKEVWIGKGNTIEYRLPYPYRYSLNPIMRNLIQLSSVELVGHLTRTPYWTCIAIPANAPVIQQELVDWYSDLVANEDIIEYFQAQLGRRKFYNGPIENTYSPMLTTAIKNYQQALGLPVSGVIDFELYRALLTHPAPETKESLGAITQ